ncbi:hypothetical protein [Aliarcobacter cryaerophilus]|uniref:hypothetical protein n=1 Tax=Aliarcobacter cryaerophilus TaxID=28198 RepID=UPI0013DDB0BB|nr:hypothetical protein [Aliarcobacter cryaerophilus]
MSFIDIKDFSFNGEALRGFVIKEINGESIEVTDIVVKFQTNRAIVFDIVINFPINVINETKTIKGSYYKYDFFATVNKIEKIRTNFKFLRYRIIIDLIEFSAKNIFFVTSEQKFDLEIIPTNNLASYLEEINNRDLFIFEYISYDEYDKKYRFLIELNSLMYKTPILIEKLYFYKEDILNTVFQSQYISEGIIKNLNENYFIYFNSNFNPNLQKYLDNYLKLKSKDDLVNILLSQYLIYDVFLGKEKYNLNDISGYIDLFDGIFKKIDGQYIEQEFICKECYKKRIQKDTSLEAKIEKILDCIEPELKKYEIDKGKVLSKTLSDFRHMVRHQKPYKKFDLEKLIDFSKGVLRLYVIKHILKMSSDDYDIDKILSDFNIYPLVQHKYKYKNDEIVIYNTDLIVNHESWNSYLLDILEEDNQLKDLQPKVFIYDETFRQELRKIYIDDKDDIGNALKLSEILIYKNQIIQNEKNVYKISLTYDELMKKLDLLKRE